MRRIGQLIARAIALLLQIAGDGCGYACTNTTHHFCIFINAYRYYFTFGKKLLVLLGSHCLQISFRK